MFRTQLDGKVVLANGKTRIDKLQGKYNLLPNIHIPLHNRQHQNLQLLLRRRESQNHSKHIIDTLFPHQPHYPYPSSASTIPSLSQIQIHTGSVSIIIRFGAILKQRLCGSEHENNKVSRLSWRKWWGYFESKKSKCCLTCISITSTPSNCGKGSCLGGGRGRTSSFALQSARLARNN